MTVETIDVRPDQAGTKPVKAKAKIKTGKGVTGNATTTEADRKPAQAAKASGKGIPKSGAKGGTKARQDKAKKDKAKQDKTAGTTTKTSKTSGPKAKKDKTARATTRTPETSKATRAGGGDEVTPEVANAATSTEAQGTVPAGTTTNPVRTTNRLREATTVQTTPVASGPAAARHRLAEVGSRSETRSTQPPATVAPAPTNGRPAALAPVVGSLRAAEPVVVAAVASVVVSRQTAELVPVNDPTEAPEADSTVEPGAVGTDDVVIDEGVTEEAATEENAPGTVVQAPVQTWTALMAVPQTERQPVALRAEPVAALSAAPVTEALPEALPKPLPETLPKALSEPVVTASIPAVPPTPARAPGGLSVTPPTEEPTVLSVPQRIVLVAVAVAVVVGLVVALVPTLVAVTAALVVFFIAANVMKLVLITRALNDPQQVVVDADRDRMADADLPIYTILLPVYHEADMLTQLVDGILALDYPVDLLDVKLLLEEDDTETREAAAALGLPACFDVLVIPDVGPRGKPRACNHGLRHARGRYLVIYDAEDRPEPDQLRKSVLAFGDAPEDVICLQAQLNYFNRPYNLLTRWFTAEYSVWFDQLLPGLQAMDVPIPLGGTSNHFVTTRLDELGGWNAFNVTEDADLGLRIYLAGWKTAILATTTYEEATSRYHNWIRQRSRWTKGYMQTYLFHMRHPFRLAREMGAVPFVTFQLFFGASTLCLLLNPLFWLLAGLWFTTHLHLIEQLFPAPVMYLGTIALFVGNAACILSAVSGCFGRRNYEDVKYAFLVPVYWVLMSVGAWKALIQLCYKPSYWEKTEHGFCRYDDGDAEGAVQGERVPVGALSAS